MSPTSGANPAPIVQLPGRREQVYPVVSRERTQVSLEKYLVRPETDAAIPPGQSLVITFSSVGDHFDILILDSPPGLRNTEGRNATLTPRSRHQARPTAGTVVGSAIDGWAASTGLPSAVFRARLPFEDAPGWDLRQPLDPVPPPDQPEDPVVPFHVTLDGPRGQRLELTGSRRSEFKDLPWRGGIHSEEADRQARGSWTLTVLNTTESARRIQIEIHAVHTIVAMRRESLPLSLVNRLGSTVLKRTAVTLAYQDGNLVLQTPSSFLGLFGVGSEFALPDLVGVLVDELPTFTPVVAAMDSREGLIRRLSARRVELRHNGDAWPVDRMKVERILGEEIERVRRLRAEDAVFCIVIEGMFSDASVDLNFVGRVAEIQNKLPQLAFVFDSRFRVSAVVSTLAVSLSPLLAKAAAGVAALGLLETAVLASMFGPAGAIVGVGIALYGGYRLYNALDFDLEEEVRERLNDDSVTDAMSYYVRGFIERITDIAAVAYDCELRRGGADDGSDALIVSYYDPADVVPPRPIELPGVDDASDPAVVAQLAVAAAHEMTFVVPSTDSPAPRRRVDLGGRTPGTSPTRDATGRAAPGPLPADFVVRDPESLNVLDRHDTIVVLMMENRSFDHYFWDLDTTFPHRGYEAPPVDFTNPPPIGMGESVEVHRNDEIGVGHTLIFPLEPFHALDPSHSFEHTMFQIGDGTEETPGTGSMQGFARDFARKSDSPQVVMGYFGMDSLPVYRTIAQHWSVCTRWFASLPVGTQPNRLSAFQGDVPFLQNLHMDDPSLGFLEDYSIFDLLDRQEIPWKLFEGDIATIRLYDRYRLNVANVRPLSDLRRTLKTGRDSGQLPRVIFIEPEFLFGNDDHPPMDIRDGQDFVKDIIGQFIDFGLLDRVLFVITYDEHGGYFDHVAPPGTPRGGERWLGKVADMFPEHPEQAPDCMGVRVPSMVLSKFVSARAKRVVLDHTSILKTILLHNRRSIATDQFGRFGERVKQGSHFGELLDLTEPRAIDYAAIATEMGYQSRDSWFATRRNRLVDGASNGMDPTHSGRVLHNIVAPRAKRFVTGGSR